MVSQLPQKAIGPAQEGKPVPTRLPSLPPPTFEVRSSKPCQRTPTHPPHPASPPKSPPPPFHPCYPVLSRVIPCFGVFIRVFPAVSAGACAGPGSPRPINLAGDPIRSERNLRVPRKGAHNHGHRFAKNQPKSRSRPGQPHRPHRSAPGALRVLCAPRAHLAPRLQPAPPSESGRYPENKSSLRPLSLRHKTHCGLRRVKLWEGLYAPTDCRFPCRGLKPLSPSIVQKLRDVAITRRSSAYHAERRRPSAVARPPTGPDGPVYFVNTPSVSDHNPCCQAAHRAGRRLRRPPRPSAQVSSPSPRPSERLKGSMPAPFQTPCPFSK